jgi:hypothetical protein
MYRVLVINVDILKIFGTKVGIDERKAGKECLSKFKMASMAY